MSIKKGSFCFAQTKRSQNEFHVYSVSIVDSAPQPTYFAATVRSLLNYAPASRTPYPDPVLRQPPLSTASKFDRNSTAYSCWLQPLKLLKSL